MSQIPTLLFSNLQKYLPILTLADQKRLPYAVCVRPEDVSHSIDYLAGNGYSRIHVVSVVGFPDGSLYSTDFKVAETRLAIAHGAKEIDMVLNHRLFKAEKHAQVRDDILAVVEASQGSLVKLILETSLLDADEIKGACELAGQTGVDFVKTSTGFGAFGAKPKDVALMRAYFDRGIKISGGVKRENVKELLRACSGREDGYIPLDPSRVRIGESTLLNKS